jgi:NADPH-ferrihemoprotein reductase
MRPIIYNTLRLFDDQVTRANTAHHGPWRSIEFFNDFALELDSLVIMSLLAIFVSLWTSHGILWSRPQKGHHLYFISPQLQEESFLTISRGPKKCITRHINDRMTELRKSIIVLWGSQSGKGERLANNFVRECTTRFNLPAMAVSLDLFDYDQLGELSEGRLVGFIVATYGEGGPTDNASGLYEYLRRIEKSRNRPLSRLQYFCFGLGDSKYQFYNRFVDFVDETLTLCGAQRIAPIGKIDEADHSDDDWLSWKDEMVKKLAERFSSQECVSKQWPVFDLVNLNDGWPSRTVVSHVAETSTTTNSNQQQQFVRVSRSLQLSGSSFTENMQEPVRTYLHMELDTRIGSQTIQYETGDHVAIWPINPNDEVALLASLFGWDKKFLKATVDIKPRNPTIDENAAIPIPTPTTREALLQYQLDICGPVSPEVLDLLASHSPNADAKAYLDRCRFDPESRSDIFNQHLTCGQLMKRAAPGKTWTEDVFSALVSMMSKLHPRYFSIASSPLVDPDSFAITVGLLETPPPQADRPIVGLTTGYLYSLHRKKNEIDKTNRLRPSYNFDGPRSILSGYKLFAHVRKSKFKLPADIEKPILMIAAGSGIAPFRGFVQERMALSRRGNSVGKMILFYGSRSEKDCLYSDIWSEAEDKGILETHFVFSAQLVDGKKFYVQHKLLEHAETTKQLIQNGNGSVYICGSANMANAVETSLGMLLCDSGAIKQLKKSKRLQEDVWA